MKIIINSYGIEQSINFLLEAEEIRHLIDAVHATPLIFSEDDGRLIGYTPGTLIDAETKLLITNSAMQAWGISAENTIGIGDSSSDRLIAPVHRLLLAFDEEQVAKNKKHFTGHVISHDWSGVREWLEHNFEL